MPLAQYYTTATMKNRRKKLSLAYKNLNNDQEKLPLTSLGRQMAENCLKISNWYLEIIVTFASEAQTNRHSTSDDTIGGRKSKLPLRKTAKKHVTVYSKEGQPLYIWKAIHSLLVFHNSSSSSTRKYSRYNQALLLSLFLMSHSLFELWKKTEFIEMHDVQLFTTRCW